MKLNSSILTILFLFCFYLGAFCQIPKTLSYQGILTDAAGNPVADGQHTVLFFIYDQETGAISLWEEVQSVTTENGIFGVSLGSVTPFNVDFDKPYWLEIEYNGDVLTPRTELTASAYSLNTADISDSIVTGDKIADGQIVRSINGLTDDISLVGGANITLTPQGNNLTIASIAAGGSPWTVNQNDIYYNDGFMGLGTDAPQRLLHIKGDNPAMRFELDNSAIGLQWNVAGRNRFFISSVLNGLSTNRLVIDSTGFVGIGTGSPEYQLDVNGPIGIVSAPGLDGIIFKDTGYAIGDGAFTGLDLFRLTWNNSRIFEVENETDFVFDNVDVYPDDDNTLSLGRAAHRWSNLHVVNSNQNNAAIGNAYAGKITPPENGLIIEGRVGIGTSNPDYALSVSGEIVTNSLLIESDQRFVQEFHKIENSIDKIRQINGISFKRSTTATSKYPHDAKRQIGLIAQEVEQVEVSLVSTGENGNKAIDYPALVTILIEAVKEQQIMIDTQQSQIDQILNTLRSR